MSWGEPGVNCGQQMCACAQQGKKPFSSPAKIKASAEEMHHPEWGTAGLLLPLPEPFSPAAGRVPASRASLPTICFCSVFQAHTCSHLPNFDILDKEDQERQTVCCNLSRPKKALGGCPASWRKGKSWDCLFPAAIHHLLPNPGTASNVQVLPCIREATLATQAEAELQIHLPAPLQNTVPPNNFPPCP